MPKYQIRFTIEGQVTPESERVLDAMAGVYSTEDDFEGMTPREALEFMREASQELGVTLQPKRHAQGDVA